MSKSRLVFVGVSVACLAPFLVAALADSGEEADSLSKNLSVFSEVLTLIQRVYVDEVSVDSLLEGALDGTADALGPLATFVPSQAVERYAPVWAIGSARSGLTVAKDRGIAFVVSVTKGSPADEIGIRPGDVLASINGSSTREMPLWQLEEVFAGSEDTEVALEVLRLGQRHEWTLRLGRFEAPGPSVELVEDVPVLKLHHFDDSSTAEVRSVLDGLASSELILDLRGGNGSDYEVAYGIAGLFATGGLGELRDRTGVLEEYASETPPVWAGELLVLIDRGTLGPGEILATVLRQKSEVELVGEPSFGHAGRQALVDLASGGQLRLTEAFYAGPDGDPIDDQIAPDVVVRNNVRALAEQDGPLEDRMLERALEILRERREPALEEVA